MRRCVVVAATMSAHLLYAASCQAIEVIWGSPGGVILGRDVDDPTAAPRLVTAELPSDVLSNGLEYFAGKIYASTIHGVFEMNVDGSGFGQSFSVPPRVAHAFEGFAQTLNGSAMYSIDTVGDRLVRDFEQPNEMTLLETEEFYVADAALDESSGKVYWLAVFDAHENGVIQRANLDGSGVETLVDYNDGLNPDYAPVFLALDVAGGKMYWSSVGQVGIRRANLDGSNIELVVPDVGYQSIAVLVDPVPETPTSLLVIASAFSLSVVRKHRLRVPQ
jgi:hypothetical protein